MNNSKKIIKRLPREDLIKELTPERFLRPTRIGNNKIYIFSAIECPNLMREVGRLRELTFRDAGAGFGKEVDIDHYDTDEYSCKQLIVWSPSNNEIIGGYRFNIFYDLKEKLIQDIPLVNKSIYDFSDDFVSDYMPYLAELSRAFIQPMYQPKNAGRKAAFSLDNIWDGLGALVIKYPFLKYFFGRITFFSNYNSTVRDSIFYFFQKHLKGDASLLKAKEPHDLVTSNSYLKKRINSLVEKEDFKSLQIIAKEHNTIIPPLIKSYYNASSSLKVFEPVFDSYFGSSYAAGIIVTMEDIYPSFVKRYIEPYENYLKMNRYNG